MFSILKLNYTPLWIWDSFWLHYIIRKRAALSFWMESFSQLEALLVCPMLNSNWDLFSYRIQCYKTKLNEEKNWAQCLVFFCHRFHHWKWVNGKYVFSCYIYKSFNRNIRAAVIIIAQWKRKIENEEEKRKYWYWPSKFDALFVIRGFFLFFKHFFFVAFICFVIFSVLFCSVEFRKFIYSGQINNEHHYLMWQTHTPTHTHTRTHQSIYIPQLT